MTIPDIDTIHTNLRSVLNHCVQQLHLKEVKPAIEKILSPKITWPELRIGNLVAKTPIVQGGMGVGISLSSLASAVANVGGIGVIAANGIGLLEKDYYENGRDANLRAFRREIRKARSKSEGIIGVNIMVAVNDFHQLLDVAIEENVDIVFLGAGLPIKNIPVAALRAANVKLAPIVSSARAAQMIFRMWEKLYNDTPDAVVVEGPKAGGHLGFTAEQLDDPDYQLEAIVPQVVAALKPFEETKGVPIPVIAGGGVYTGKDIYKVLSLGASGVQMATRFVATDECDADIRFKEAYVSCTKEQIGLIKSPVGMPGRAIRNQFILNTEAGKNPTFRCAWKCLASCKAEQANYCISIALNNARRGLLNSGFVFAGSNAYRVKRIIPVATLVEELQKGYQLNVQAKLAELLETLRALIDAYGKREVLLKELTERYEQALAILPSQKAVITALKKQYGKLVSQEEVLRLTVKEKLTLSSYLAH
ncbi:MAG: NAD(P)H-dependent flavin oxidoreductase [Sphaerochaetaceae bacterium]